MDHFGLEVGTDSIKAVWLLKKDANLSLNCMGEAKNPSRGLVLDSEKSMTEVAGAIKKLVVDLEIKPKVVFASLPEDKVTSRVLVFPPIKDSEIEKALFYEVETFVPYPQEKTQLDYQIIERTEERVLVFVVAAQKQTIEQYEKMLKMADLVPAAIETNTVALARALTPSISKPTMILDLGAQSSTMIIVETGNIYLTRGISFGGDAFTRAISTALGMDILKAEEYKKTYGLKSEEWESKVKESLKDIFSHLADEIKKGILSYKEEWDKQVDLLILSGGGAMLPGLTDELLKILGIEIQIGQPLYGIDQKSAKLIGCSFEDAPRFAVSVGLAKRELEVIK